MAQGRHVRHSRLRARLLPVEPPPPSWRTVHAASLVRLSDDVQGLQEQVDGLRTCGERSTAVQVADQQRAEHLAAELAATRELVAALRADVDALREELVWALAERRPPVEAAPVTRLPARRTGTA